MDIIVPKRLVIFLVFLMALSVIASIAYVRLPRAVITVYPQLVPRTTSQVITLSAAAQSPDFKRFTLPATIVEAEVTEEVVRERGGSNVREDFAKGVVVLRNDQGDPQSLVAKSHLRHEETGVFFLTDSPVTIPPEGEVSVAVTAKEVGPKGNVAAGKFAVDRLPTSLQEVVYGESSSDFTGGIVSDTPITEEEVAAAKNEALTTAQQRAVGALTAKAGGAPLPPELVETTIASEDISAAVGSAATSFSVRVTLQAKGFVVDKNDLLSLTLLSLKAMQTEEEEFVSYEPESFTITTDRSDFSRGEARVEGTLTGLFSNKLGSRAFQSDNLAGLSAQEVRERFEELPAVEKAEVSFWPFWVNAIPAREAAVEISVRDVSNEVTVSR